MECSFNRAHSLAEYTRTPSTVFPNSRCRMPPLSAEDSELAREQKYLPTVVGFVRKHVARHFRAGRPRLCPCVSAKLLDAARAAAEDFGEHLYATSGTPGRRHASLLLRAARAVEFSRNLQVRSREPDPLGAHIMNVRENCRDGANLARRFCSPGGWIQMRDRDSVDAIVGNKDLVGGPAECCGDGGLARRHGGSPSGLIISPDSRQPWGQAGDTE